MRISVFAVGADGTSGGADALNTFLGTHRVISVEKALVQAPGGGAYWSFSVSWLDGSAIGMSANQRGTASADRTDFKKELSETDFALFVKLRDLRKRAALDEGVPMYMVFTNAQLAEMARSRPAGKAVLRKIEGIGEARVEKYGDRFLEEIAAHAQGGTVAGTDRGAGESETGLLEGGEA